MVPLIVPLMLETAQEWIDRLDLKPLEIEGGYYREICRSDETIEANKLPVRYATPRAMYTSIYYLLTPESCSLMHRLQTDELFTFVAGDPVNMLLLYETGTGREVRIGNSGEPGIEPHFCVPRRVWQGCNLESGGKFALLTATVAPGFDRLDFELGKRNALVETYSSFKWRIKSLTRATADSDSTGPTADG